MSKKRDFVCERCEDETGKFVIPYIMLKKVTTDGAVRHEEPCVLCSDCREKAKENGWKIEQWEGKLPSSYLP